LLHSPDGSQRWLDLSATLRSQRVADGSSLVILVPPDYNASQDDAECNSENQDDLSMMKSTYLRSIRRPATVEISTFYVNLSDYETLRRLGTGAFGRVYAARHKPTGLEVAVKELDCDVTDQRSRELFEREVQILGTVRHPALLSLDGCTRFAADPAHMAAILTPLMTSGSLDDVLKQERSGKAPKEWNATRKQIVLLGVASGMMFMHDNRFIHRDLKPGNILLEGNLEPRISDFGLSKLVQSGQTLCQSVRGGTAQFMAPEIYTE
jgi:serine/threonine protein kinase